MGKNSMPLSEYIDYLDELGYTVNFKNLDPPVEVEVLTKNNISGFGVTVSILKTVPKSSVDSDFINLLRVNLNTMVECITERLDAKGGLKGVVDK